MSPDNSVLVKFIFINNIDKNTPSAIIKPYEKKVIGPNLNNTGNINYSLFFYLISTRVKLILHNLFKIASLTFAMTGKSNGKNIGYYINFNQPFELVSEASSFFNIKSKKMKAETEMKVSARLKTGHILKSRKSITAPNRNRSIRLPNAPPIINPTAICCILLRGRIDLIITNKKTHPIATKIYEAKGLFLNMPKAMPVFFTKVR